MRIGNQEFATKEHTYVMGILNVTPDSFSDGGKLRDMDDILFRVEKMIEEGVHIIDVGGESTRPGYIPISDEEEIERVVPVIEEVKRRFNIPISLDTYKHAVAKEGIRVGADMINDIWGLKYDNGEMARLIADTGVNCCLMHNRKQGEYISFLDDVIQDLSLSVRIAGEAGIADEKIILDPGVGFAKTYEQNIMILSDLKLFTHLGYPVLLGASRKSVIGQTLNLPVEERLEGTLVTTVMAVLKGCSFVRVHDIKENVRAIKMAEAMKESRQS